MRFLRSVEGGKIQLYTLKVYSDSNIYNKYQKEKETEVMSSHAEYSAASVSNTSVSSGASEKGLSKTQE